MQVDRGVIRAHLEEMLAVIAHRAETYEADLGACPDLNEYASRVSDQQLLLSLQERDARLWAEITLTLGRLESTEFGFCEECGEPIGMARLLAKPTATLCVACQERSEA